MLIWIRMYFSADVNRQLLFIKVKQRNSFPKHQLYSNFTTKMIIATSFECRAPVASLKKTGSLVPYHLIIDFFLIPAILLSLSMMKNKCIWLRVSAMKKHNTNMWKYLIWFSEKKAGYMMKMLKRNKSYCKAILPFKGKIAKRSN